MVWILLASLAAATPAGSSVYTPLDLDRCRAIERIEEGESVSLRCPGLAGIPLFVNAGDGRHDLDAGVDNNRWESLPGFNRLRPRVEWRRRGRTPVAIIYRYILTGEQAPGSVLAVASIGRRGRPGCLVVLIAGSLPDANMLARTLADRRASTFRCGRDPVERHGLD